jgi:site-specific DNA-methyltransferase (cytosine-N4-specific)
MENRPGKDSWFCLKCDAWKGDLGLEPDPILFVNHLCDIADKIKPKLKDTGTIWWNIGDKMNASGGAGSQYSKWRKKHKEFGKRVESLYKCLPITIKRLPKHSHMMVPELFALTMEWNRGWILKRKIIWFKKDYMCRSYKRNFTESWEPMYLFAKTNKYFFNQLKLPRKITKGSPRAYGGKKYPDAKIRGDYSGNLYNPSDTDDKNMNDVWMSNTSKTKEKHHATFPIELALRCIKAGCPPNGTVLDPFAGIGQTNLAARLLGVNSIGIELFEKHVEIAKRRYDNPYRLPEYRRLMKRRKKVKQEEECVSTRDIR